MAVFRPASRSALIDEYRQFVYPVTLGNGTPYFRRWPPTLTCG
jgi:hypothetical protein